MANLMQMRQSVRSRLGVGVNDNFVTDDSLDSHINIAVQTIEAEHLWPWQEVRATLDSVAGTNVIALPDNWSKTRALTYQGQEVNYVTPYDLERYEGSGVPSHYTIINRSILLGPEPVTPIQLVLFYYKNPTYLSDDTDTPEMPARYYPAIVAKTAELMSVREDDRASASNHMAEYFQWVKRMQKENRTTSRPAGRRIRPGAWV